MPRNRFIAYPMFWVLLTGLHIFIVYSYGITFTSALIDGLVSNITLYIFCLVITNILFYYQPGFNRFVYLLAWGFVVTLLWFLLMRLLLPLVLFYDDDFVALFKDSLLLRFVLSGLMVEAAILMVWVWQNFRSKEEEDSRYLQLVKTAKDAEINSLKQQMQPHFLFNSLNSVSSLLASDPSKARNMVLQLSDFLRGTLRKNEQQTIPLSEDIEHLNLYLEIEKVRFGHRLKTDFEIDDSCLDLPIPPLMVQPLLENAIKYGLYGQIGQVVIQASLRKQDNFIEVVIKNPFDSSEYASSGGAGYALEALRRRLFLMYNRTDLLTTSYEDQIFTSTLKIPI